MKFKVTVLYQKLCN